jgi:hypothetical protein
MTATIELVRGDSAEYAIAVTTDEGPQEITGAELTFTAKTSLLASGEVVIEKTIGDGITVDDAVEGLATLAIAPEDTSGMTLMETSRGQFFAPTLYWDLQLKDLAGNIYTLNSGTMVVRGDATIPVP